MPRSRFQPRLTRGVLAPRKAWRLLQGASPCRGRGSHPPVARRASMAGSGLQAWRTRGAKRRQRIREAAGGAAFPAVLVQLRPGSCGRRGFSRARRHPAPIRQGEEGQVRRSPQAVAGRKSGVEARGRPQPFLPGKTTGYGLQRLRHGRGNPDTEHCWNRRPAGEHVTGRWRSTVTGQAPRMRLGRRSERRTLRWGKPPTGGRSRRKHAAQQGHAVRTGRTGIV